MLNSPIPPAPSFSFSNVKMEHIEEIRLIDVVPRPLASDTVKSGVWHSEVSFRRGQIYRVDAVSGAGKSSLCAFLMGVRTDYLGHILYNNMDIARFGITDWCRMRVSNLAYLPQELGLFPALTALENVRLKNDLTHYMTETQISTLFERLEIAAHINKPVSRLSVGQKQRVALIRTLCQPFDFLILDEPVSHLDARTNDLCAAVVADALMHTGGGLISTSVGNTINIDPHKVLQL